MATIGRADVSGTVPTIVSKRFQKYTMPNLVFWKLINHEWTAGIEVGDRIQIPTYNTRPTDIQITTGLDGQAAEPDPSAATFSDQTVSSVTVFVQNFWHLGFELSWYADAVAQGDLKGLFRQAGMDALSVRIDSSVAALATGFTTNDEGTLGVGLTDQNIRNGFRFLNRQDAPRGRANRAFVHSEEEETNLLALEKYTNTLYRPDTKPLTEGDVGDLYGMSWHFTTNVNEAAATQHNGLMFHRDAIGGTIRRRPMVKAVDRGSNLSDGFVVFGVWGVNETRDAFGVRMRGL
jgi:hypothetical protein